MRAPAEGDRLEVYVDGGWALGTVIATEINGDGAPVREAMVVRPDGGRPVTRWRKGAPGLRERWRWPDVSIAEGDR